MSFPKPLLFPAATLIEVVKGPKLSEVYVYDTHTDTGRCWVTFRVPTTGGGYLAQGLWGLDLATARQTAHLWAEKGSY